MPNKSITTRISTDWRFENAGIATVEISNRNVSIVMKGGR